MNEMKMQMILNELNEDWGIDFVSSTAGDCCNTCSTFKTLEEDVRYEEAETIFIVKWFFEGMNYTGTFEEHDSLHIRYDLGNVVSIEKVCSDLKNRLDGVYEVIEPKNEYKCIELIKK